MNSEIYKHSIKTSLPIVGYYKYKNIFQIIESKKVSDIYEKGLDIEYDAKYHFSQIDEEQRNKFKENDRLDSYKGHLNFFKILLSLLSIATNNKYFDPNEGWIGHEIDEGEKIDRFSNLDSSLQIRKVPNRIYFEMNSNAEFLSIQDTADIYFDKYFNLTPELKEKYNSSIYLFFSITAIKQISSSLAIVGLVSCIENLIDIENSLSGENIEVCSECGQKRFRLSRKFKDFLCTYSHFEENENCKNIADKYYSKRSSITHAGSLLTMDLQYDFTREDYQFLIKLEKHVRVALYNYIIKI
jgi:hypothetical protein